MSAKVLAQTQEQVQAPLFHKTKLCKFYVAGKCRRSKDCRYAHNQKELRPKPDFSRTRLCPFMRSQMPCTNPECTFAHSPEELRARTPEHAKILEDFRALMEMSTAQQAASRAGSPMSAAASTAGSSSPYWTAGKLSCWGDGQGCPPPPPSCSRTLARQGSESELSAWSAQSTSVPQDDCSPWGRNDSDGSQSQDSLSWYRQESLAWSRQESVGSQESLSAADFEDTDAPLQAVDAPLVAAAVASALGLKFAVKHTFMDFEVEERPVLRRVRSAGDLLA